MKKSITVLVLIFTIMIFRIFYLCVINKDYYNTLLNNKTNITVYGLSAPRGRILDAKGRVLVDNKGIKTIVYNKCKLSTKEELELAYKLAENIESIEEANEKELKTFWLVNNDDGKTLITDTEYDLLERRKINIVDINKYKSNRITQDVLKKYSEIDRKAAKIYSLMNNGYSYDKKIITKNITDEEYAKIIELNLPGITTELSWERNYNYGDVLKDIYGLVGVMNKENKNYYLEKGYIQTDIVGISNLELEYDEFLQGTKAIYKLDSSNTLSLEQESKSGNDLYLSIDIDMQTEINKILENNIINGKKLLNTEYYNGSYVVVLDSKTGQIKTMTGRKILNSKQNIFNDSTLDILNSSYTVGSIVKGASMTVGYQNNLIEIGKKIKDSCVKLYLNPSKCSYKDLGYIDDITALKTSSNYYQFITAIKLTGNNYKYDMKLNVSEDHFNIYRKTFEDYGLGSLTGIDLPNENTGIRGSKVAGDLLLNFAIGQYDTYTILEVAQYMNTIANNGTRYKLNLMKNIKNKNNEVLLENETKILNKVELDKEYYERIKEGLRQVLFLGTGYGYTSTEYKPAGKTGTSESFLDSDADGINDVKTITSTYAMFAPLDDPKYTIVVVSPNVSHYNGKTDFMAYINRYISKEVSNYVLKNY